MPCTITGTLVDAATNLVTSGTFVRFQLRGTHGIQPMVTGVGILAQGSGSGHDWFVDFAPNASGQISGSVYSTRDNAGTGAGEITVNGDGTVCWYEVSIWRNGKKIAQVHTHAKTSATLDIGNMTPISATPVVSAPTGDQTYDRLDGSNAPRTGQSVGKNGTVGSPSFTFASSTSTGFWRQAADVIGVSIAGALKWLVNSAGQLFGSAQAIAWSSNADPSLAAGDSWITRVGAAIWGFGSTNGGTNGELRLAKVNKVTITQPATGSTLTIADGKTATVNNSVTIAGTDGKTLTVSNSIGLAGVDGKTLTVNNSVGLTGTDGTNHTLPNVTGDTIVELAATQALTNKALGGSGSTTPDTTCNRLKANRGSSLVTGDAGTLTGWGTTATVSAVTGTDAAGTITISSSGTGQALNPSFVFTFHDGTWTNAPTVVCSRGDGNNPQTAPWATTSITATGFTVFFLGTPVAGNTYTFSFLTIGR